MTSHFTATVLVPKGLNFDLTLLCPTCFPYKYQSNCYNFGANSSP